METRRGTIGLMFSAAVIGALLTGCAPEPEPAASPTPEPTVEEPASSPSPTPTDTSDDADAAALPSCDEFMSVSGGPAEEIISEDDASLSERLNELLGPESAAMRDRAEEQRHCAHEITPYDTVMHLNIAVLEQEGQDELIAALRESDYWETPDTDVSTFIYALPEPFDNADAVEQRFIGDLWIVSTSGVDADSVIDDLRTLRPELTE